MLDIANLAIDSEVAEEGKWIDFFGTDAGFKIRRFNNERAEQLRAELTMEFWDVLYGDDKDAANKKDRELKIRVLSQEVLVDWRGLGEDGKELEYSPEVAFEYLSDPKYVDIRRFVENQAMRPENWRVGANKATDAVKPTADS